MPTPRPLPAALLVALVALSACASSGSAPRKPHRATDLITAEDIQGSPYSNAYEVVQSLHSNWLTGRGQSLDGPFVVRVIMDDQPYGTADQLRAIPTMVLASIRWVDGPTASSRWGLGYAGGAVVLTSIKR